VNYNPADFFLQTLSIRPDKVQESHEKNAFICEKYRNEFEPKTRVTTCVYCFFFAYHQNESNV